jgi:multidrug transporter EmrE-like cation transporter
VNTNLLLMLAGYSALLCAGQGLFKMSAPAEGLKGGPLTFMGGLIQNPVFVTGCIVYALSTFAWVAILTRFQLSYAYPLVIAFSILLTSSMGIILFREQITFHKLVGIIIVTAGVVILARSNL